MVACPNCAARFSASPEIEAEWYERHVQRNHAPSRVASVVVSDPHPRAA